MVGPAIGAIEQIRKREGLTNDSRNVVHSVVRDHGKNGLVCQGTVMDGGPNTSCQSVESPQYFVESSGIVRGVRHMIQASGEEIQIQNLRLLQCPSEFGGCFVIELFLERGRPCVFEPGN